MESISDTLWDVVICGTGLQQSLLALSLSRSDKKILHIDPNDYYGGAEASLNLPEADAWAKQHQGSSGQVTESSTTTGSQSTSLFSSAAVSRPEESTSQGPKMAAHRAAYALALAPQFLHARSALVDQLVSSRAFRQLEFLAVSSFFVLEASPSSSSSATTPTLVRIPATREDVFANKDMPARSKRQLMKFLKSVLAYEGEIGAEGETAASETTATAAAWRAHAAEPMGTYLQMTFGLDERLRDYVLALTLSLDGANTTVADGLFRLHRHITSMGAFGPGFAAVYPKWGGCSEIAQVACRAGAVGGAVYMLGAGIRSMRTVTEEAKETEDKEAKGSRVGQQLVELDLSTGERVKSRLLACGSDNVVPESFPAAPAAPAAPTSAMNGGEQRVSRLIAIVGAPLDSLFAPTVEGAPVAGGAVIAIPAGRNVLADGSAPEHPIFVSAHSGDTGECPPEQSVLYLTTVHTSNAKTLLESALGALLSSLTRQPNANNEEGTDAHDQPVSPEQTALPAPPPPPRCLYQLYYEQARGDTATGSTAAAAPPPPPSEVDVGPWSPSGRDGVFRFPPLPVDLTVADASLGAVREAWALVVGNGSSGGSASQEKDAADVGSGSANQADEYMVFIDREGNVDEDDDYE